MGNPFFNSLPGGLGGLSRQGPTPPVAPEINLPTEAPQGVSQEDWDALDDIAKRVFLQGQPNVLAPPSLTPIDFSDRGSTRFAGAGEINQYNADLGAYNESVAASNAYERVARSLEPAPAAPTGPRPTLAPRPSLDPIDFSRNTQRFSDADEINAYNAELDVYNQSVQDQQAYDEAVRASQAVSAFDRLTKPPLEIFSEPLTTSSGTGTVGSSTLYDDLPPLPPRPVQPTVDYSRRGAPRYLTANQINAYNRELAAYNEAVEAREQIIISRQDAAATDPDFSAPIAENGSFGLPPSVLNNDQTPQLPLGGGSGDPTPGRFDGGLPSITPDPAAPLVPEGDPSDLNFGGLGLIDPNQPYTDAYYDNLESLAQSQADLDAQLAEARSGGDIDEREAARLATLQEDIYERYRQSALLATELNSYAQEQFASLPGAPAGNNPALARAQEIAPDSITQGAQSSGRVFGGEQSAIRRNNAEALASFAEVDAQRADIGERSIGVQRDAALAGTELENQLLANDERERLAAAEQAVADSQRLLDQSRSDLQEAAAAGEFDRRLVDINDPDSEEITTAQLEAARDDRIQEIADAEEDRLEEIQKELEEEQERIEAERIEEEDANSERNVTRTEFLRATANSVEPQRKVVAAAVYSYWFSTIDDNTAEPWTLTDLELFVSARFGGPNADGYWVNDEGETVRLFDVNRIEPNDVTDDIMKSIRDALGFNANGIRNPSSALIDENVIANEEFAQSLLEVRVPLPPSTPPEEE